MAGAECLAAMRPVAAQARIRQRSRGAFRFRTAHTDGLGRWTTKPSSTNWWRFAASAVDGRNVPDLQPDAPRCLPARRPRPATGRLRTLLRRRPNSRARPLPNSASAGPLALGGDLVFVAQPRPASGRVLSGVCDESENAVHENFPGLSNNRSPNSNPRSRNCALSRTIPLSIFPKKSSAWAKKSQQLTKDIYPT